MEIGDLVIATKYSDGNPRDHFVVGFFNGMTHHNRFIVVDSNGTPARGNGFRKAKAITDNVGAMIVENIPMIEKRNKSVWYWVNKFEGISK